LFTYFGELGTEFHQLGVDLHCLGPWPKRKRLLPSFSIWFCSSCSRAISRGRSLCIVLTGNMGAKGEKYTKPFL